MTKVKINIKSDADIAKMREGGEKLHRVKIALRNKVAEGVSAAEIEDLAQKLIKKEGAKPSFSMVPGYKWATCVNINEGVVHGIPHKDITFVKDDVVSVDVGLFYQGFHTDTSLTVYEGSDESTKHLLASGKKALKDGISQAIPGNRVYDISKAIEKRLHKSNLNAVKALVGHGIGRELHEDPMIPCYTSGKRENSPELPENACLAIEVMFTAGNGEVYIEEDGWTISTHDGKIAALFEETVAVTKNGPIVLT